MSENEYLLLSNRVNISRAKDMLMGIIPDGKIIGATDLKGIYIKLSRIEDDLYEAINVEVTNE